MRRDLQSSQERIREMVTQGKLAASFTPIGNCIERKSILFIRCGAEFFIATSELCFP